MKDSRTVQILREVRWAVALTLLYLVGWIVAAYYSPTGTGIFGFPLWFEAACLYVPALFCFATYAVIKWVFKPIDLSGGDDEL